MYNRISKIRGQWLIQKRLNNRGKTKSVGKKTNKDLKKGKATIISLLGYENAVKYTQQLKKNIFKSLKK